VKNCHNNDLEKQVFEKAYSDRGEPEFVLFHLNQGSEYTEKHSRKDQKLVMLSSLFPRKDIHMTMHVAKASFVI